MKVPAVPLTAIAEIPDPSGKVLVAPRPWSTASRRSTHRPGRDFAGSLFIKTTTSPILSGSGRGGGEHDGAADPDYLIASRWPEDLPTAT